MLTNLDAQFLEELAQRIDASPTLQAELNAQLLGAKELIFRLKTCAQHMQHLDELVAAHQPNDFALGVAEATKRIYARANLESPKGTADPVRIAEVLDHMPITKVPLGKRTINPVTGKTFAEEALADRERLRSAPVRLQRPAKPKAPSIAQKLGIDLSDIEL